MRRKLAGVGAALALGVPRLAEACGLSPPIGPNGLPTVCHGDEAEVRFRAGLTGGGTSTQIDFGDSRADLVQGAATATLDVLPLERLTLSAAAGASLGGHVDYGGRRFTLRPGPIGGLGISYRLLGERLPFVHASLTVAIARSTTHASGVEDATFTSRDWRLGVAIGQALGKHVAPFVVARYFGAGTEWSVGGGHGSDHFRYHVGAGSAFGFSEHVDGLVEIAFLGERRASIGVGYLF
jgi:hypothetical protein